MANIWQHPSKIAQEALLHLEDSLVIAPLCAMDKTAEFTTRASGWKVGDTVTFRTHGEYNVDEFQTTIATQSIRSSTRPLTIEKHFDISVELTAKELALDLDSFSEQVLRPSMYALAERCDTYLGTKILQAAGLYVSDDLLASAADVALARKAAIIQQLSMNRYSLVDHDLEAKLLGQPWFNQAQTRGQEGVDSLNTGRLGHTMGMDWFASIAFPTNVVGHTAGAGTALVNNGAGGNTNNQIGATTLTIDGGSVGVFNAGDRLRVAGLRRPLIVKTTTDPLNTPVTSVALVDPITEIVPDNAAITVIGSGQSLIYHGAIFDDKALGVAFPMLDLPESESAGIASANGINVRIVKAYDINTKKTTFSMDFMCGAFMLDPRHVTLLAEY